MSLENDIQIDFSEENKVIIPILKNENYEVLELLSSGSYGYVYKVKEKKTGNFFALKIFKDDNFSTNEVKNYYGILKENQKNIIKFIDVWDKNEILYDGKNKLGLLMEYFDGKPLNEIENLSEEKINIILDKTMDALHALNEKGRVHGDLKPDNIMFNEETLELRLIDLGFAGKLEECKKFGRNRVYSGPENREKEKEINFDYWPLGLIRYELKENKHLFKNQHVLDSLKSIDDVKDEIKNDVDNWKELKETYHKIIDESSLSEKEKKVIKKLVDFKENRYKSIPEIKKDLESTIDYIKRIGNKVLKWGTIGLLVGGSIFYSMFGKCDYNSKRKRSKTKNIKRRSIKKENNLINEDQKKSLVNNLDRIVENLKEYENKFESYSDFDLYLHGIELSDQKFKEKYLRKNDYTHLKYNFKNKDFFIKIPNIPNTEIKVSEIKNTRIKNEVNNFSYTFVDYTFPNDLIISYILSNISTKYKKNNKLYTQKTFIDKYKIKLSNIALNKEVKDIKFKQVINNKNFQVPINITTLFNPEYLVIKSRKIYMGGYTNKKQLFRLNFEKYRGSDGDLEFKWYINNKIFKNENEKLLRKRRFMHKFQEGTYVVKAINKKHDITYIWELESKDILISDLKLRYVSNKKHKLNAEKPIIFCMTSLGVFYNGNIEIEYEFQGIKKKYQYIERNKKNIDKKMFKIYFKLKKHYNFSSNLNSLKKFYNNLSPQKQYSCHYYSAVGNKKFKFDKPGVYTLKLTIDPDNKIPEYDETNNTGTYKIEVK